MLQCVCECVQAYVHSWSLQASNFLLFLYQGNNITYVILLAAPRWHRSAAEHLTEFKCDATHPPLWMQWKQQRSITALDSLPGVTHWTKWILWRRRKASFCRRTHLKGPNFAPCQMPVTNLHPREKQLPWIQRPNQSFLGVWQAAELSQH